jgi:dimethylargininase
VPPGESYAANCVRVNETVLIAAGFPVTCALLGELGYPLAPLDVSEFRKMDGGLSCLSLRW